MSQLSLSFVSAHDLDEEIIRARKKFPNPDGLFAALVEEFGEACDAVLTRSQQEIRREFLQVACVAMRLYEETDPLQHKAWTTALMVEGAKLEALARHALTALCGEDAAKRSGG
jgi:hypothetical protein